MESALNQPLRAQIELLSATSDDVKELQVKLASREAFLRAGVDRSALLSQIKFKITKSNSKYYVTLTTQESIREPFLNFLVELNWKNGRMLREYTVLLDPAGSGQQTQMAQAPETTPPESEPAPAPAPAAATQEPVPAPTSPFMEAPESAAPAPAEAPTESAAAQPEPLMPAPETQAEQAAPEPMPTPAPAPAPQEAAAPEPMPAPAPAPTEAATPTPETPFETAQGSEDDGRLFPAIPLRAYKESDLDKTEAAPAPEPAPMPAGEEQMQAGTPAPMPTGELDYGITKKGDNLWSIAEKIRPSDQVTVYQVMMALQQSNPKAFVNGNVNRLKVGQVMRIDDPSLLTSISKQQAVQEYQAQTRDWENYLASTGHNVPRQTIVAGEQPQASSGSGVPSGELTLASPQSEKNGAGTGESDVASSEDAALLEQQARKAMQDAKNARQRNADVNAKLDELDAELKKMENLVTVKNSDLAELQRKLDELNAQREAAESAPTPAETAPVPETPEAAQPEAPAPEAPEAGAPPAPPPVAAAPEASEPPAPGSEAMETPEATEAPSEPTQAAAEPSMPSAPPVAAPPAVPTPAQTSAPQSGGFMDTVKGMFSGLLGGMSAMVLIAAGVVIVVVLLLIFIIVRRRKGENFQESILTGVGGDEESASLDTPSQESSLMGGESSFLSDFAISGVSAIQAEDSEVDPLTEADVFMAYGRYEAAEERLQEAIAQDPQRGELRVKLLELFNTTKDKQAFESAAEDFYAALGSNADSNPLWQKVVAMGRELVPENPLFSGGVAASASASPTLVKPPAEDKPADVMDIGLDTGVFNTSDFSTDAFNEPSEPAAEEPAHTDSGLDFNLDIGQSAEETPAPASDDMDFSLDLGGAESSAGDEDQGEDLAAGLDFSLDSGDEPTAESLSTPTQDDMDLSFNLDGDEEPTATEIKLDEGGNGSGGLDFDFADSGIDSGASDDTSDASVSLDTMGGGDEVGTKLDLARAYIDMGDPDGARSILDEVMAEGNDGQKQEAQQLMTQIG